MVYVVIYPVKQTCILLCLCSHSFLFLVKIYSDTRLKWKFSFFGILAIYNSHISGQIYKDSLCITMCPCNRIRLIAQKSCHVHIGATPLVAKPLYCPLKECLHILCTELYKIKSTLRTSLYPSVFKCNF